MLLSNYISSSILAVCVHLFEEGNGLKERECLFTLYLGTALVLRRAA